MDNMLKFDMPKNQSSIIKVLGVGGGGSNAVSHMYSQGIQGVDFFICNTDAQAMEASPVPTKVQLGSKGLGAGSLPSVGKEAATENIEDIKHLLEKNTKMLFITAGMGGGTGTGAAPVIAEAAKNLGILTVGIVTLPFLFEGRKRKLQAEAGIEELRKNVDTLLIISNDKLREVHGDLKLSEAFQKADNILTVAAKGIAEIITVTGYINVDFEDVKTVMNNSGTAIMGSSSAEGENRAIRAVEEALSSPLLNDNRIDGASNILLYIASGDEEITMDEVMEITDYIQNEAGQSAEIIWGNGKDPSLGNKISITLVATGFKGEKDTGITPQVKKTIIPLVEVKRDETREKSRITTPITEITRINPPDKEPEIRKTETITQVSEPREEIKKADPSVPFRKFEPVTMPGTKSPATGEKKITEPVSFKPGEAGASKAGSFSIEIEKEEIEKKASERIQKLKDLSIKLKTPGEIEEMEKTPAFVRRNVELAQVKHSSESEAPNYTLSENTDKQIEIKSDNSYLHKDVD
jgi:cell division protein FtsZ